MPLADTNENKYFRFMFTPTCRESNCLVTRKSFEKFVKISCSK